MPVYDQFSHVGGKEYCKTKAGTPPHINFCVPVIINSHRSYVKPIRFIYLQFGNQFSYELISNELLCPRQNTPLAKKLTRDVVIFSCKKNENTNILRSDQSPLFPDLASAKTIALRPLIP